MTVDEMTDALIIAKAVDDVGDFLATVQSLPPVEEYDTAVGLFIAVEENDKHDLTGNGNYRAQIAIDMTTARRLLTTLPALIEQRRAELGVDISESPSPSETKDD